MFSTLNIWKDENFRKLQGTIPVISLTFDGIKCNNCKDTIERFRQVIADLYLTYPGIRNSDVLQKPELEYFDGIAGDLLPEKSFITSLQKLCGFLHSYYSG